MNCQSLRKGWLRWLVAAILATPAAAAAGQADGGVPAVGPQSGGRAEITIHVPAGAMIWFDGEATTRTGATRVFVTPTLEPGREYVYDIHVRWKEDGDMVERTRRLTVQAGDAIGLDFSGRGVVEVMGYSAQRPDAVTAPAMRYVQPSYRESSPAPTKPHIYNRDDYPPSGGPPGIEGGVGQG